MNFSLKNFYSPVISTWSLESVVSSFVLLDGGSEERTVFTRIPQEKQDGYGANSSPTKQTNMVHIGSVNKNNQMMSSTHGAMSVAAAASNSAVGQSSGGHRGSTKSIRRTTCVQNYERSPLLDMKLWHTVSFCTDFQNLDKRHCCFWQHFRNRKSD